MFGFERQPRSITTIFSVEVEPKGAIFYGSIWACTYYV